MEASSIMLVCYLNLILTLHRDVRLKLLLLMRVFNSNTTWWQKGESARGSGIELDSISLRDLVFYTFYQFDMHLQDIASVKLQSIRFPSKYLLQLDTHVELHLMKNLTWTMSTLSKFGLWGLMIPFRQNELGFSLDTYWYIDCEVIITYIFWLFHII